MEIPSSFFNVSFNKAMAFGYKTEEVDEFVTQAIQHIHDLQEENATALEKMSILANNLSKYREEEDSLRSALVGAQKLGDSILRDCRSKAEAILRDATSRADKVTEEAALDLERSQYELDRIKAETTEFKEKLFALYRTHLDHISSIPSSKDITERHRNSVPPSPPTHASPSPTVEPTPIPDTEPEPPQQAVEQPLEDSYQPEYGQHNYDAVYEEQLGFATVAEPLTEPDNADIYEYDTEEDEPEEEAAPTPQHINVYDFPNELANDDDFDDVSVVEFSEIEYQDELVTVPAPTPVVVAVAAEDEDNEQLTTYIPRTRSNNASRKGRDSAFEPLSMVQMDFFDVENQDDDDGDGFFADAQNLRSVDLNKIPYFDDEDEDENDFESTGGKHRVSKKFGELKFGDSFNLADD